MPDPDPFTASTNPPPSPATDPADNLFEAHPAAVPEDPAGTPRATAT